LDKRKEGMDAKGLLNFVRVAALLVYYKNKNRTRSATLQQAGVERKSTCSVDESPQPTSDSCKHVLEKNMGERAIPVVERVPLTNESVIDPNEWSWQGIFSLCATCCCWWWW
jgi:hypothetical protein